MKSDRPWGPTAPDDPSAPEYAQWHALVSTVVTNFRSAFNPITRRVETKGQSFFKVMEARISRETAFLRLRQWRSASAPRGEDMWVGGVREGMYSMALRPDGGFQVAGDKLFPITDRTVESMSAELASSDLDELKAFLDEPV